MTWSLVRGARAFFLFSQGDTSLVDDGKAVAYAGCKTACGATLISSQMLTHTTPSAGAALGSSNSASPTLLAQGFGMVDAGIASRYHDEPADDNSERYRGRFQLIDATTGGPIPNQAVRVRSTEGRYLTGTTDADGYTQWVEREACEALAFDLVQDSET